jgi:hypothetical protein
VIDSQFLRVITIRTAQMSGGAAGRFVADFVEKRNPCQQHPSETPADPAGRDPSALSGDWPGAPSPETATFRPAIATLRRPTLTVT